MGANRAHTPVANGVIDQSTSGFSRVAFSLIAWRNTVGNLSRAIGIWRTSKSAHADHQVVDLVNDGEAKFPRIRRGCSLELNDKIRRSCKQEIPDSIRHAHAGRLLILSRPF